MRTKTPLNTKRIVYSDFGRDMVMHPVSGDVSRKINEDSVKESIRNLILTDKMERPMRPFIGCDVRKQLFNNFGPEVIDEIRDNIMDTLEAYEPRADIISVDIFDQSDLNAITISIRFQVINTEEPQTLNLILHRIR